MEHRTGCLICGKELVYSESAASANCYYCGAEEKTNATCAGHHYVCDRCHRTLAEDLISEFCMHTDAVDPVALAISLMRSPEINMHGPEHHFLVPAVLLACYCNLKAIPVKDKVSLFQQARQRADEVKGGFCGFQGACGAAIGTGIFISVINRSTPCSETEWSQCNRMTAKSLLRISQHGGPRCCKRNSLLAIHCAVKFLKDELGIGALVEAHAGCSFTSWNRECRQKECPFFDNSMEP